MTAVPGALLELDGPRRRVADEPDEALERAQRLGAEHALGARAGGRSSASLTASTSCSVAKGFRRYEVGARAERLLRRASSERPGDGDDRDAPSRRGSDASPRCRREPGRPRSSRMRSGRCSRASSTASAPSRASATTSKPASSSTSRSSVRVIGLSSTVRTDAAVCMCRLLRRQGKPAKKKAPGRNPRPRSRPVARRGNRRRHGSRRLGRGRARAGGRATRARRASGRSRARPGGSAARSRRARSARGARRPGRSPLRG